MPVHEVGSWFSTTVQSLADQDYPDLRVTFVHDRGADGLLANHVEQIDADLVAVEPRAGFGARVNAAVAECDEPLLLICHDDIALDIATVSALVRERRRREGTPTIVAPKLVDWNEPGRLVPAGFEADRFGETAAIAKPGDLDQGQQDRVSDVFGVSTACLLIGREFFMAIGGFDPAMDWHGEAHDLSLRARSAGATIVLSSAVAARHRGAFSERGGRSEVLRMRRHQMRSVFSAASAPELIGLIAATTVLHMLEFAIAVVRLDLAEVRSIPGSWLWNLRNIGSLRSRRSIAADARVLPHDELQAMRRRGSVRISDSIDRRLSQRERASEQGEVAFSIARIASALTLGLILAFGARHLITQEIPTIGEFRLIPADLGTLSADWWNGWRTGGMGSEGYAPFAYPLLDVGGVLTLGIERILRIVLVVAPIPIGVVGAWRLFGATASVRAPIAAAALYAASPLPYNALSGGSQQALLLYAALPWMFGHLVGMSHNPTFARPVRRGVGVVGVVTLLALLVAFSPWAAVTILTVVVGLLAGSFLAGDMRGAVWVVAAAVGGVVGAALVNLPFLLELRQWTDFGTSGTTTGSDVEFIDLLRLRTGPAGDSLLGWAVFAPLLFPLFVAKGQRFTWAMRSWGILLVTWAFAWTAVRGWLPFETPVLEVLLAPVALATALLGGLGGLVLDRESATAPARVLAIGVVATVGFGIAMLPLVQGGLSGRWELARTDLQTTLQAIESPLEDGSYRVLWIGDSHVLGAMSWPTANELAWTSSINGIPDVRAMWAHADGPATDVLGEAVTAGIDGRTSRLGRELSRFGVRYIVVVDQQAPRPEPSRGEPVAADRASGFASQLDLVRTGVVNPAVVVYENTAWAPIHAAVPPVALETLRLDDPAPAVTQRDGPAAWSGQVRVTRSMYAAWEPSIRWTLRVEDQPMERVDVGPVGMGFDTTNAGEATAATFVYQTSDTHRLVLGAQIAAWLALAFLRRWIVGRERRQERLIVSRAERAS